MDRWGASIYQQIIKCSFHYEVIQRSKTLSNKVSEKKLKTGIHLICLLYYTWEHYITETAYLELRRSWLGKSIN